MPNKEYQKSSLPQCSKILTFALGDAQERLKQLRLNDCFNKPGPAQVGAISKAQKLQKDFQVSSILLQYSKIENFSKKFFEKITY